MIVTLAVQPTETAPALVLRPWTRVDLPALVAAHADPVMRRFLARPVLDEADAEVFLAAQERGWADGTRFSFAVFEAVDEVDLVGMVAVKRADAAMRVAEIGYWTVAKARGRGIAPRSVAAVAGWALGEGGSASGGQSASTGSSASGSGSSASGSGGLSTSASGSGSASGVSSANATGGQSANATAGGLVQALDLLHTLENEASCRVAQKCGFVLAEVVPPHPPAFPEAGHRHRRSRLGAVENE